MKLYDCGMTLFFIVLSAVFFATAANHMIFDEHYCDLCKCDHRHHPKAISKYRSVCVSPKPEKALK